MVYVRSSWWHAVRANSLTSRAQEYYTAHGKDADFVAQHVFKTASVIKTLGKGMRKINSVVLRPIIAKSFLREALTARQMRVEIWAMEGGNKNKWDVQRQASDSVW